VRRCSACILAISLWALWSSATRASEPEIAEIFFDSVQNRTLPNWVKSVAQVGGILTNDAWTVEADAGKGVGNISILIDRKNFNEDVALVVSTDRSDSEMVVQLYDDEDQPIVTNLFGNVLEAGDALGRDVFSVPLRQYANASKIVLQRIHGLMRIYGVVLFPLVAELPTEPAAPPRYRR